MHARIESSVDEDGALDGRGGLDVRPHCQATMVVLTGYFARGGMGWKRSVFPHGCRTFPHVVLDGQAGIKQAVRVTERVPVFAFPGAGKLMVCASPSLFSNGNLSSAQFGRAVNRVAGMAGDETHAVERSYCSCPCGRTAGGRCPGRFFPRVRKLVDGAGLSVSCMRDRRALRECSQSAGAATSKVDFRSKVTPVLHRLEAQRTRTALKLRHHAVLLHVADELDLLSGVMALKLRWPSALVSSKHQNASFGLPLYSASGAAAAVGLPSSRPRSTSHPCGVGSIGLSLGASFNGQSFGRRCFAAVRMSTSSRSASDGVPIEE